jgi:hypothetical protein
LILGNPEQTLETFIDVHDPAPIGAVMPDLERYTSAVTGLKLFDVKERYRPPRLLTYCDVAIGRAIELHNDYTGERLAIAEFNDSHRAQKISQAYNLSLGALFNGIITSTWWFITLPICGITSSLAKLVSRCL